MACYGINGIGAYVPRLRIERSVIAEAHRWMNPSLKGLAKGRRAFCSWDEDSITMAVEAARSCLGGRDRNAIGSVEFVSTTSPYADVSGAVIVASALGLDRRARTANIGGSHRAATTALLRAFEAGEGSAMLIASERPMPVPGAAAELQTGAGAVAVTMGSDDVAALLLGAATLAVPFIDRFRASDHSSEYVWEERWIRDEGHLELIPEAVEQALVAAGIGIGDVAHLILPSPIRGVAAAVAKRIGFVGELFGSFESEIGYCGAAHGMMLLAETLEQAAPGERILMIGFGQGVDALVLETTESCIGLANGAFAASVAERIETRDYLRLLSFYGRISLDWGMRSERGGKAALTENYRSSDQLDTFAGGRCGGCGTVQFPVSAYCVNPDCTLPTAVVERVSLADEPAEIFTATSDWLSYHPAPPLNVGFVQFANGARVMMEIVDASPEQVEPGTPVRMVYRIKERDQARGFNRYFWKATPVVAAKG